MRHIIIFVSLFLLLGCSENATDSSSPDSSRDEAPSFTLESLDHGTVSLDDYSGDVVVLFFLGYNCPLCIGEGDEVENDLHRGYADENVQVLGLDVWDGTAGELANNFKIQTGATYPLLMMASPVGADYGVNYDTIVIVDQQQNIAYKKRRVNISEIKNIIGSLLNEEGA